MWTQIFLVTSVRGIFFPPQMVANAGDKTFGAKMPTPFFFIAAFVGLVVFTFGVVVFFADVVLVISIRRWKCTHEGDVEEAHELGSQDTPS